MASSKSAGKQTTAKYMNRPSPPFPANMNCGKTKKGNDGRMWTSVKNQSTGICTWRAGSKVAVKKRAASKAKAMSKPKAKSRSASPCPKSKRSIRRKSYTRKDGVRVRGTTVCLKK